MGFNSGFKGLINVLYVNKYEFCASSWRSPKVKYAKTLRAAQLIIVNTLVCCNKKLNFEQVNVLMSNTVTSV